MVRLTVAPILAIRLLMATRLALGTEGIVRMEAVAGVAVRTAEVAAVGAAAAVAAADVAVEAIELCPR